MVSSLRAVWRVKDEVILFCTPLILLPLPLIIGTTEAGCAYVITLMAVYWCTEALPLAVTALLPMVLFPLFGVMQSKHVCMQYLKDTNMLFVGGLMVAVAVESWNLHKRIALRVLLVIGVQPAMLMLGFMGVTAFLSMWINNTATTAMMVPIVQAILEQLQSPQEQTPAAGQENGTTQDQTPAAGQENGTTQDQTPATGQENGTTQDQTPAAGQENGTTQDQTPAAGQENGTTQDKTPSMLDCLTGQEKVGSEPVSQGRVTCQDKTPSESVTGKQEENTVVLPMVEMQSEEEEEDKLKMCKGLTLCVCYAASIGGTATLTGTGPNLVLTGQMNQLFPQNGDVINFASWFAFAFPTMVLMLLLAWLWLQVVYVGTDLRRSWGCGSGQSEKERAAYTVIKAAHHRLGPMSYAELNVLALFFLMVTLWFTRDPRFISGWATYTFNVQAEFVSDATVAVFVALLLFILPSKPPRCLCCWRTSDTDGPAPALLTWQVAQERMPWNIVLLLGGGFALAKGSEVSGLSRWLGDQMTPLHSVPPWAIAVIICLLIATFTECASNVTTATLFLPILATLSQSIAVHPLYVMIPCTLSASFAFMLPVATPPNAIVFSYGYLKVSDMAKTGVVMNLIGILCITVAINSWGRAMFQLDTFPSWANATLVTSTTGASWG